MNILDLNLCDTTNEALFTSGTINFLQDAYKQGIVASVIMQIGSIYDSSKVYILYGCSLSVVGGNNVISSGAIFYNGEFYLCSGNTLSGTSGTIISNLLITPYTTSLGGDPMEFTVTGSVNVHNIRTCNFVYGTSGSGSISGNSSSDYLNLINFVTKYSNISSFGLGWIASPSGFEIPKYRLNTPDNRIYMYGWIICNSTTPDSNFMNLSFGFPPERVILNATKYIVSTDSYVSIPIKIEPDGSFWILNPSDIPTEINDLISLYQISFSIFK